MNNLVFEGKYSAEEIRNEICAFLISKKHLYENLWEGDFDTHIRNMKWNGFWKNSLEIIIFSDMMRLNISIYTSLDQNFLEVEINHPQYIGVINLLLRNLRHYFGLQKHKEDSDKYIIEYMMTIKMEYSVSAESKNKDRIKCVSYISQKEIYIYIYILRNKIQKN